MDRREFLGAALAAGTALTMVDVSAVSAAELRPYWRVMRERAMSFDANGKPVRLYAAYKLLDPSVVAHFGPRLCDLSEQREPSGKYTNPWPWPDGKECWSKSFNWSLLPTDSVLLVENLRHRADLPPFDGYGTTVNQVVPILFDATPGGYHITRDNPLLAVSRLLANAAKPAGRLLINDTPGYRYFTACKTAFFCDTEMLKDYDYDQAWSLADMLVIGATA